MRIQIKCNAEHPVCANCSIYGHACSYQPISEDAKEAGRERHYRVKRRRQQQQLLLQEEEGHHQRRRQSNSLGAEDEETDDQRQAAASPKAQQARDASVLDASSTAANDSSQPWQSAHAGNTAEEARVARILVSANGVSSYHGRTSALFEDNVQERPTAHPRMPDDWVERGLMAEAARQRESKFLVLIRIAIHPVLQAKWKSSTSVKTTSISMA